jgi:hypothetical protein
MRGQILGSRVRGGFAGEVPITVNVPGGPSRTVTTVPASAPTTRPAPAGADASMPSPTPRVASEARPRKAGSSRISSMPRPTALTITPPSPSTTGTIMWTCAASCRFAFGWRRRARRGRCARRSGRCRRGRTPRGSRRCSWRRAGGARDGQVTRVRAACGSAAEHAQDPTCAECDRVTAPLSVSLTA